MNGRRAARARVRRVGRHTGGVWLTAAALVVGSTGAATEEQPTVTVFRAAGAPVSSPVLDVTGEVRDLVFSEANRDGSMVDVGGRRFSLDADVLFRLDEARLTPQAGAVLDSLIARVKAAGSTRLRVDGHTDSSGSDRYNRRLSRQRADTVAEALRVALPGVRIDIVGHGEADPVADNGSRAGRALNRRVEVIVLGVG